MDKQRRPDFTVSTDVLVIEGLLGATKPGDIVTYETLSKAIGKDVRENGNRMAIYGAQRRLKANNNMVFGTVMGVGIKRLNDEEIVDVVDKVVVSINRKAKRGLNTLSLADYTKLSEEKKTKAHTSMSMLGVLAMVTSNKSRKRIEAKVEESKFVLPNAITLDVLKGM